MDEQEHRSDGGGRAAAPSDEELWVAGPKRSPSTRPARRRPRWGLALSALLIAGLAVGGALKGPELVSALGERMGSSPEPTTSPSASSAPSPTPLTAIVGLTTTKVGPKVGVQLAWEPVSTGGVTYAVSRDGAELGRTTDASYTDETTTVGAYYYYSVIAYLGTDAVATSEPLLVAVLSREQVKASPSPTISAPTIVIIPPPPAPSPTGSASPTRTSAPPPPPPSPSPTRTKPPSPAPDFCDVFPTATICK